MINTPEEIEAFLSDLRNELNNRDPESENYFDVSVVKETRGSFNPHSELKQISIFIRQPAPLPLITSEFEIWMEGHKDIVGESKATLVGRVRAVNFPTACNVWGRGKAGYDGTTSVAGQQLFDNEQESRLKYG